MTDETPADADEARLIAAILSHASRRPDAMALSCEEASLTWRQLSEDVLGMAGAIRAGVGTDDQQAIALLGGNSAQLVIAYLATIAAGHCAVPLPISASAETLAGMIADCRPALIFADRSGFDIIASPPETRIVGLDFSTEGAMGRENFVAAATRLDAPVAMSRGDDFNIIYSSGTTARPKGIVHGHAMRYRQAVRATFGLGPDSTMLLATPLYSNTTIMPLLATLVHGGHVILMRKFSAGGYLELAAKSRATHTMLVPIQYQRILAEPDFDSVDLGAFVVKQCTGAPLPPALKQQVIARWPGRLLEIYGLTEGGCTSILDVGAHPEKAHTVGRPAPDNDIRVIDETGSALPNGQIGEIVGRSPTMMTRYFENPQATEAFYWHDGEGNRFHRTGDIGLLDEQGFLVLRDRKKDVIISGGFNIYASDLEHILLEHPDVADAAVIAIPSAAWGETPLGLVVLKSGTSIEMDALCAWANARVGKMQRLSGVERSDELPRSPAGKILKQELRKPYWPAVRAGT